MWFMKKPEDGFVSPNSFTQSSNRGQIRKSTSSPFLIFSSLPLFFSFQALFVLFSPGPPFFSRSKALRPLRPYAHYALPEKTHDIKMIPLVLAIAFAFVSFIASAFVILRIVIPILPPHPLSRRVSPAEFGLPTFRTLSPADRTHVWLASLDLIALAFFLWETVVEATGGVSSFASAADPVSSIRLSVFLTIRQIFLLVVTGITLLHVRLGRPVTFGKSHWVIWAPSLVFVFTSTALSGVVSGAGINTLFYGLIAYNSAIVLATTAAFSCLIGTLLVIKRNLNAIDEKMNPWPPVCEERPRPSFATEDIEALREGGSWISSNSSTSSRHNSLSAWSFSTQHTAPGFSPSHGRPQRGGRHSVPSKASYWVSSVREDIPPVPPLPSLYSRTSPAAEAMALADSDPFRRDTPRPRLGSQTSWLTSTNGSHTSVSAWSFSTHEPSFYSASMRDAHPSSTAASRHDKPALGNAQVLGGYGYASSEVGKESSVPGMDLDVSIGGNLGWFVLVLVPYAFSLPYLISASQERSPPLIISILFMLSVTLSSPFLALNVLFKSPFPIPTGLFDASTHLPANLREVKDNLTLPRWSYEYKHSMSASVTVVEGRRSGDVWIAKGDAVDGKSKLGRALEVLNPRPKLSVIPPQETPKLPPPTPPLPMQDEDSFPTSIYSYPEASTQLSHARTESKSSSHLFGRDENLAVASKIMIAHRHYSALAQTVVVPSTSPGKEEGKSSGAMVTTPPSHLRARSISSFSGPITPTPGNGMFRISPTPPPSFPLPPTPPSVRDARLALAHKRSFSSGFNLKHASGINEIDTLTAGILPYLVPGLKIGEDMTIKDDGDSSLGCHSRIKELKTKMNEFGFDFSSPQMSSTPARGLRNKKSGHRRNHYSLPSLGLGKDGNYSLTSWSADIRRAIERKVAQFQYSPVPSNVEVGWRNTVFGAESIPNAIPRFNTSLEIDEEPETLKLVRSATPRLHLDIPHVDSARASLLGMSNPVSIASSVTLIGDIEDDFQCGPLAESTPPHNMDMEKKIRKPPPRPLPLVPLQKPSRTRSSIAYIKSEDSDTSSITLPDAESTTVSTMASIAQWSTQAVKPLIPKASRPQNRVSKIIPGAKPDSTKTGLRPLTLLQDRTSNRTSEPSQIRPLTIGKKQKSRRTTAEIRDENTPPQSSRPRSSKNLKPLKLVRSETSKMRGTLRRNEVLPDVVIRPPSGSNHPTYVYDFWNN